jgi:chromosome segregation ATPase
MSNQTASALRWRSSSLLPPTACRRSEAPRVGASYEAQSARRELVAIRDLARKLQLPCQREIHALAKRLHELSTGKSAPPLNLTQGMKLYETVHSLRAELDRERQAKEVAEEMVERARDEASAVEERLARLQADKMTAQSERDDVQRELDRLRGHVQGLEQEADRRQDQVDALRADLDDPEEALHELDLFGN